MNETIQFNKELWESIKRLLNLPAVASCEDVVDAIRDRFVFSGVDGCSTGDCSHGSANECVQEQAKIIAEQELDNERLRKEIRDQIATLTAERDRLQAKLWEVVEATTEYLKHRRHYDAWVHTMSPSEIMDHPISSATDRMLAALAQQDQPSGDTPPAKERSSKGAAAT